MSWKTWLSIITVTLIAVIIYASRDELLQAWSLLGEVNIWILLLLIPGQIIVYYIGGETMFSYLRSKGSTEQLSAKDLAEMSLEMNFVNHVLPSGGVSGISYMTWRLGKFGIPAGRATMANLIRFAMTFAGFIVLLLVAVLVITIDGDINRWIIFISFMFILLTVVGAGGSAYLLSSRKRMWKTANWVVKFGNRVVRQVTFGKKKRILRYKDVEKFFTDMHYDFVALRRERKILARPFIWGIAYAFGDTFLYLLTFWALGIYFNPAAMLVAYGMAMFAGIVVFTPGGTGAFEAMMIGVLVISGVARSEAIAGVVLTRVILLLGTILLGYVFYQRTILKYGKQPKSTPTS